MENNNSNIMSREKIDQVAIWLGSTLSSAFFSSLERFSCINVSTDDPDYDDDEDDVDVNDSTVSKSTGVQVNGHNSNDVANLPV